MMRPGRLTFTHDRYLSFRHSDSPDYLTAFAVDTPQDTVIIQHNPLTIERNRNRSDPFQCHTLGRDSQQVTFAGIVSRTVKHIPDLHRAGKTIRPDFRYECGRKHPSPAFTPMLVIFDQLRPAHITTGLLRPILIMGEKEVPSFRSRQHPGAGTQIDPQTDRTNMPQGPDIENLHRTAHRQERIIRMRTIKFSFYDYPTVHMFQAGRDTIFPSTHRISGTGIFYPRRVLDRIDILFIHSHGLPGRRSGKPALFGIGLCPGTNTTKQRTEYQKTNSCIHQITVLKFPNQTQDIPPPVVFGLLQTGAGLGGIAQILTGRLIGQVIDL